jgi:hypothetical protein
LDGPSYRKVYTYNSAKDISESGLKIKQDYELRQDEDQLWYIVDKIVKNPSIDYDDTEMGPFDNEEAITERVILDESCRLIDNLCNDLSLRRGEIMKKAIAAIENL